VEGYSSPPSRETSIVNVSARLGLEHNPGPRPKRRATAFDLARVAFFAFGFPGNAFGSIDVTSRCNLRCRHCYYFAGPEEELPHELDADQWVARLEDLKLTSGRFPVFSCIRGSAQRAVEKFLDCGILDNGFARVAAKTVTPSSSSPSVVRRAISAPAAMPNVSKSGPTGSNTRSSTPSRTRQFVFSPV
jgi:hypothetical protein